MNTFTIPLTLACLLLVSASAQAQTPPAPDAFDCVINRTLDNSITYDGPCEDPDLRDDIYVGYAGRNVNQLDLRGYLDLRSTTIYLYPNSSVKFNAIALVDANTEFVAVGENNNSAKIKVYGGAGFSTLSYEAQDNDNPNSLNALNAELALCPDVCNLGAPAASLPVAPVTLLSWTTKADGTHVVLDWATSDEEDNSHFTVLHSTDGSNFSVLGNVGGQGTTGQISTYSLRHTKPSAGVNYYRIDQYDYDGTKTELGVQSVRMSASAGQLLRPSPNPVASGQRMMVGEGIADNTEVQIVSPAGRLVGSYVVQGRSFRVPELTPGVYTLRLNGEAARFVVAR